MTSRAEAGWEIIDENARQTAWLMTSAGNRYPAWGDLLAGELIPDVYWIAIDPPRPAQVDSPATRPRGGGPPGRP